MADITNTAEVVRTAKARGRRAATQKTATAAMAAEAATETAEEAGDLTRGRLQSLAEQVTALAQQVERFAGDRYGDARGLASGMADAGAVVAARAGRQTVATANAIRRDPLPVLVTLGIIGLIAALLLGRANRR